MPSLAPGKKEGLAVIQARARLSAEKLCGEGLEVLVDTKLSISQQCALAATRSPSILGYMNGSTGRRRVIFFSLFSTAPNFSPCPKHQQSGTNLESTQDGQGLQHRPCKDRMRVLSMFSVRDSFGAPNSNPPLSYPQGSR